MPVQTPQPTRHDFPESLLRLRELGLIGADEELAMPDHFPEYDDEGPLGFSIFRTLVADTALDDLTIPRTFIVRSELKNVSFRNTDLSGSNLCWNDFINVDFTGAELRGADLRASLYACANFTGADLRGADLRHARFNECVFIGATMDGAICGRERAQSLPLSPEQHVCMAWTDDEGPEPDGG